MTRPALLALAVLLAASGLARAESQVTACQTVNGKTTCTRAEGNVSCLTKDGETHCTELKEEDLAEPDGELVLDLDSGTILRRDGGRLAIRSGGLDIVIEQ